MCVPTFPWSDNVHDKERTCFFQYTGSYEVKNYGSIGVAAEKAAAKPSAAFRPADYLDRFGRSMVSKFSPANCLDLSGHPAEGACISVWAMSAVLLATERRLNVVWVQKLHLEGRPEGWNVCQAQRGESVRLLRASEYGHAQEGSERFNSKCMCFRGFVGCHGEGGVNKDCLAARLPAGEGEEGALMFANIPQLVVQPWCKKAVQDCANNANACPKTATGVALSTSFWHLVAYARPKKANGATGETQIEQQSLLLAKFQKRGQLQPA
eukprot:scaffold39818_cov17-Tisochrysis_lutea.AAC.1